MTIRTNYMAVSINLGSYLEVSKNQEPLLGSISIKDHSMSESMLGAPDFWKLLISPTGPNS